MKRGIKRGLSRKQQLFVQEYLKTLNASQAALDAGYSEKTAGAVGHENLKKPKIAQAIEEAMSERGDRIRVDQDWVLRKLIENVERSMQLVEVLDKQGNPTGEYRYEGNVANRALELVGKHLGMYTEKYEHSFAREAEIVIGSAGTDQANNSVGLPSGSTNGSHVNGSV